MVEFTSVLVLEGVGQSVVAIVLATLLSLAVLVKVAEPLRELTCHTGSCIVLPATRLR